MIELSTLKLDKIESGVTNKSPLVPKESIWRHKKTNTLYKIKDLVVIESTVTLAVSYTNLSSSEIIWVRPLDEFLDGRFERVNLFKDV